MWQLSKTKRFMSERKAEGGENVHAYTVLFSTEIYSFINSTIPTTLLNNLWNMFWPEYIL